MPNKCSECGKEIVGKYATLRITKGGKVTDLTDIFCLDCAMDIQHRNIQQRIQQRSVGDELPTTPKAGRLVYNDEISLTEDSWLWNHTVALVRSAVAIGLLRAK